MSLRAFTPAGAEPPSPGGVLDLDEEESRYLVKVRRARVGDSLELFDGRGGAWRATLRAVGRRAAVELGPALAYAEPPARVVLLGLPDQSATLEALVGASELGATDLLFVACERSNVRVPPAPRIERVLRAAQRQCGRPRPPALLGAPPGAPLSLAQALALREELPGAFAWEALRDEPKPARPARPARPDTGSSITGGWRLLVGPEGGLTAAEVEAIGAAGFRALGLGPWVLRTPTAVTAMLARFQAGAPAPL